jgi:hypothetical protein
MATKKTAIPADEKLENQDFNLFEAIAALDKKDYGYYYRLTPEQQRKFVPFMLILLNLIIPKILKNTQVPSNWIL